MRLLRQGSMYRSFCEFDVCFVVKNGSHPTQKAGNGNMVVANWVRAFGGSSDKSPTSGAVFSSAGTSSAGHTGVVSHVFENGDILIVEQNYASYSGDGGGFGKYSWNYRYVTTAELKMKDILLQSCETRLSDYEISRNGR